MKGKITALVIGLVLGSTGVAVGASQIAPWRHTAPSYTCHGFSPAAWCRLRYTPYDAYVHAGRIGIFYGGHVVFDCASGRDPVYNCTDYR